MKKVAVINPTNLAAEIAVPEFDHAGLAGDLQLASDRSLLQLHQRLQVTLDTELLINAFLDWLSDRRAVEGLEYVHLDKNISFSAGNPKHHKAHYVLRLQQCYLGEVTLSSLKRFSEQDLYIHEQGLAVLIHYLRNCLDHFSLEKTAFHDALTGVMNRTALDEMLPRETKRAQRYHYDLSIMMIDVDHFKAINDKIGHLGGDCILRQVAQAIQEQLRDSDLPFRFGGDEFLIILPNTNLAGSHSAGRQIQHGLKESASAFSEYHEITPELSIGAAAYQMGDDYEELVRRCDVALYQAKRSGRNCIC